MTIRALVFGSGRMGKSLLALADEIPEIDLVGLVSLSALDSDRRSPPYFKTLEDAASTLQRPIDMVIDFTLPEGTATAARWCADRRVALLSGVTGIDDDVHEALDFAADFVPVLWAPNLSFGVNVMAELVQVASRLLDPETPVSITDVHHREKIDSPSGTALMLQYGVESQRKSRDLPGSGSGKLAGNLPEVKFNSRREGDVVGDHSVTFEMKDETLVLSHHAHDRRLFARGALEAAIWLSNQAPGRYSAADWIRGRWTETKPFK